MSSIEAARLRIADLVIDPGQRRVMRGDEDLQLGKLTFEVLIVLAERAPDLVTQDELAESVWKNRVVSPEAIAQRVKMLRQALGDDANAPCYVRVVRGQGYQLIPHVTTESRPSGPNGESSIPQGTSGSRRPYAAIAAAAVILLIGFLVTVHMLKDQPPSAREAAAALVQDAVAIVGNPLSSNGLADELVARANRALNQAIEIDPDYAQPYAIEAALHTPWEVSGDRAREAYLDVTAYVIEALRRDPNEPLALATQAQLFHQNWRFSDADRLFDEALGHEPDSVTLGLAATNRFVLGKPDDAVSIAKLATESFPDNPNSWHSFGMFLYMQCRYDDALNAFNEVIKLDNTMPLSYLEQSMPEFALGHYDDAKTLVYQALNMVAADYVLIPHALWYLARLGESEEAIRKLNEFEQNGNDLKRLSPYNQIVASLIRGNVDDAAARLEQVIDNREFFSWGLMLLVFNPARDEHLEGKELRRVRQRFIDELGVTQTPGCETFESSTVNR